MSLLDRIFGRPLATQEEGHQRVGVLAAIPIGGHGRQRDLNQVVLRSTCQGGHPSAHGQPTQDSAQNSTVRWSFLVRQSHTA